MCSCKALEMQAAVPQKAFKFFLFLWEKSRPFKSGSLKIILVKSYALPSTAPW